MAPQEEELSLARTPAIPRILPTLLVFLGLSLVLIGLIFSWDIQHSRFALLEYSLALVELSIAFVLLGLTYSFLRMKLQKNSIEPKFRWAILLLVPALGSLVVCFEFLVAIPTDGDEGWAILLSSVFYPFFVLFSSQFFLLWHTELLSKTALLKNHIRSEELERLE